MRLEHVHLTVNAKIDPAFKGLPKDEAERFVERLLKEIDMKPLGKMKWAEAEDLDFPGQSFVQMISTSHVSLHYFSETNEIYFDLYSCRPFDDKKVVGLLDELFGLGDWHGLKYVRANDAEPKVERMGNKELAIARN
jgi:S-adenosylmethionine/arginine decarboxylase-like enzyme